MPSAAVAGHYEILLLFSDTTFVALQRQTNKFAEIRIQLYHVYTTKNIDAKTKFTQIKKCMFT